MIIEEDILKEIFEQLPKVKDSNNVLYDVNFGWGTEDVLNLWLSQKKQSTKYPLIWLIESESKIENLAANKAERDITLIIAKESSHKTNTNPVIWETEFKNILNPLAKNILTALQKSGVTTITDGYSIFRKANYYESSRQKEEKNETKNFTIDCWNIILLKAKIVFDGSRCINEIKF
ncbi:MAG: hypothetical protein LH615_04090 [Ferruginibacter sp.]|nr:hypothetical protein [Ferruginibacter sp.]